MLIARTSRCLAIWISLLTSAPAVADSVTVRSNPSQISTQSGSTAEILIDVDIHPNTDGGDTVGGGKPDFSISVSSGTISPSSFTVPLQSHVRQQIRCVYSAGNRGLMTNQAGARRRKFLQPLLDRAPDKVRTFVLGPGEDITQPHSYVHTKMYIIDDEFALIGSANTCRRSMTHDSEVAAAICDQRLDDVAGFTCAHRLRIALWAEHLGMDTMEGHAELADGVASAVHWLNPPSSARIKPYEISQRKLLLDDTLIWWGLVFDPAGGVPRFAAAAKSLYDRLIGK